MMLVCNFDKTNHFSWLVLVKQNNQVTTLKNLNNN